MGLHTNTDYEVISNAEISSAISKYSLNMIDMSLDNILQYKSAGNITCFGIGNMVVSYENNFKIDMWKYPQAAEEMKEMRIECYNIIIDKVCTAHLLSYHLPAEADIYTSASFIYSLLISDFYKICINFFVNYIIQEVDSLYKLCAKDDDSSSTHQYAKRRYNSKSNLAFIHTNLDKVIDEMYGFDITIYDIINFGCTDKNVATFLNSVLIDNGDFYKNFCYPAVSGVNRPEAVTNIRLALMPVNSQIKDFIEEEN